MTDDALKEDFSEEEDHSFLPDPLNDAKYKNSTKTKSIPVPSLAGKNGKFSKPSISFHSI